MAMRFADAARVIRHVWTEPKALLDLSRFDGDWWEPRWDIPYRRQDTRDREEFGGQHVAAPKPPNEGPDNPDRLSRELLTASDDAALARGRLIEAEEEEAQAAARIVRLQERLEAVSGA